MPKITFTEAVVRKLKPGPKQIDHSQKLFKGRSVIMTVNTSGLFAWSVGYYDDGKPAREKFGEYLTKVVSGDYATLSVQEALKTAREYDVNAARARRRAKAQGVKAEGGVIAGSFRDIAERYFKQDVEAKGLRTKAEIRRMLEKYLCPVLADRPFVEIRRGEISELLDGIEAKGQANAVMGCFRQVANWYAARDENYVSPIVKGMKRHTGNGNDSGNGKRWLQERDKAALGSIR
jgi:Phage integrase central domain